MIDDIHASGNEGNLGSKARVQPRLDDIPDERESRGYG